MTLLTHRLSPSGALSAAYLGTCRVGYAQRHTRGWVWNLSLVRPEGGLYMGREPELADAQRALEACTAAWVGAALPDWEPTRGTAEAPEEPQAELATAKTKVPRRGKKVLAASSTRE